MPVRGTTAWLHARHAKRIVINEGDHEATGGFIFCAWEDCDRDAVSLYQLVVNHGRESTPYVTRYAFCSERHRDYFAHSHRDHGNLPPGARSTALPR